MIRNVILHLHGEQPMKADIESLPSAEDAGLLCTNLRTLEGGLDLDLINVGTGRPSTTRALLNAIVDQLGPYLTSRPGVADTPHRDGDVAYSVLDVDPFIERFGDPVPLAEGIRRTVAAFAPPSPGASS